MELKRHAVSGWARTTASRDSKVVQVSSIRSPFARVIVIGYGGPPSNNCQKHPERMSGASPLPLPAHTQCLTRYLARRARGVVVLPPLAFSSVLCHINCILTASFHSWYWLTVDDHVHVLNPAPRSKTTLTV